MRFEGPNSSAGGANIVSGNNGLSVSTIDATKLVLGQNRGQVGDPAQLLSDREIPFGNFDLFLKGSGFKDDAQVVFTDDMQLLWNTPMSDPGAGNSVNNNVFRIRPLVQNGAVDWIQSHSATNFFGVVDEVMNFGWNIGPTGGLDQPGRPAIGWSVESYFSPSGNPATSLFTELHQFYINPANTQFRISSFTIDVLTDNIDYFMTVGRFYLKTNPGPSQFVYFLTQPGNTTWNVDATHSVDLSLGVGFGAQLTASGFTPGVNDFFLFAGFSVVTTPGIRDALENVRILGGTAGSPGAMYPENDQGTDLGLSINRWNHFYTTEGVVTDKLYVGSLNPGTIAWLTLHDGSAAVAPLLFDSLAGPVLNTTPQKGAMEMDANGVLYFTQATGAGNRLTVYMGKDGAAAPATSAEAAFTSVYGAANAKVLGDPVGWATLLISGTNYKIPLYT